MPFPTGYASIPPRGSGRAVGRTNPGRGRWIRSLNRRPGIAGFTLLEVMAALAIVLLALTVLYGGIAGALRTARSTAAWQEAVSHARSRLAAIDNPESLLGERRGDDGNGYLWTTRVRLIGTAPAPRAAREGKWRRGTGLYAVSVIVSWREGRAEHDFALDGAVLGPVPAAAP